MRNTGEYEQKKTEQLLRGQMEKIQAVRNQLESLLNPEEELCDETLTGALAQICPDRTEEELAHACARMKRGIKTGEAEMKYYAELGDVDCLIHQKVDELTADMTEAQKKGFYMSLYQVFHKDLDYADMSGEMARFLAEMPEEELKEGLWQLLGGEAGILAVRQMRCFMDEAGENLSPEMLAEGWKKEAEPSEESSDPEEAGSKKEWTREEQWLLNAASIYAASVLGEITGQLALYPELIGKMAGAEKQAAEEISNRKEDSQDWMEIILLVFEILVLMVLAALCGIGIIWTADLLGGVWATGLITVPAMVLLGVSVCFMETACSIGVIWGVAAAFDKFQEFAEETAVPKVRAVYRELKEKLEKNHERRVMKCAEEEAYRAELYREHLREEERLREEARRMGFDMDGDFHGENRDEEDTPIWEG